ncbi:serine/threonine-protein kinase 10-like isoform X2 [Haliotis asinina]|uniref:serine/threonine-protein kinase 10-like isoform X2 n=1 Tax=Haliotis asinina TaxID=109174 RepID=UPI0035322D2B
MSGFLSSFKKLLRLGGEDFNKKKAPNKNIIVDVDPLQQWDIIGEIGDGAFGKVYKAENKEKKTFAALKQVEIKGDDDLEDFSVEINILSECKHENVVGLHEAYFFDGKLSMFIEFCGGGALDSIMVDLEKPLSEDQIRYVLHEMCSALEFIHLKKVIHRDLKAGNVLLTMDGDVKLADFGVSAKNTKTMQRRDTFIGTPYWMAPEVILCETLKDTPYDSKADIWSLGITAIEFAQIEPPNHEMHPMRVLIKIQKSDPPRLEKPGKWSREFNDFVGRCLQKSPGQRPSAADLYNHPFVRNYTDKKPILDLILEAKADVVETVTDLSEEEDIKEIKRHMSDDSQSIDLDTISSYSGETDKHDDKDRDKSVEKETTKTKTPSPDRQPSPEKQKTPERAKTPSPVKEKSPSPVKEKSPSPVKEKSPVPDHKQVSEDENKKAPSPKKSPAPPPPAVVESPEEKRETSPVPVVKEPTPPMVPAEVPVEAAAEAVNTQEKEEIDRSSDEGIGPSGDERSEGSQTESPAKTQDVVEKETEDTTNVIVAYDIADDIIDDVIKSTRVQPSVPSVVFDTIQDMTEAQIEEEQAASVDVNTTSITSDTTVTSSTSDTTITSDTKPPTEEKVEPAPAIVEEVKVNVPSSDVKVDESVKDVITINGQPVPETGAIVINGHATVVKDTVVTDVDKNEVTVEEKRQSVIPETDLDTFVTKMTSDDRSPVDSRNIGYSNPDDDLSDKRSETGSATTDGSLEREESKKADNNIQRRKKIRERNESKSHYRTMTKTRTYMKDGKFVTTTTSKVVAAGEENRVKEEHNLRKQDLRELKLLQKQENKQYQDLMYKAHVARDAQEKKFEADMQNLVKNFDQDMETLTKQQKQQVEKAELAQSNDMKNAARKIKTEQEKEVKIFKEQQKQELKLLKQEMDLLPRDGKKEAMRKRKEAKEIELTDKERLFLENQQERMEKHMKQLGDQHRQKIALLESQFLQQKQQLLRAREAAIWEMEKEQLHEKHQLAKGQLKEMFFLKRHQMLTRHQKEIDQMKRYNSAKEEEMKERHALERRRLPKILKNEAKTRAQMFKQSLRLSTISTPDDDKMKIKQFEENEKKRMKAEQQRQESKHKKQWDDLVFRNESALKELEQLQAEKRKMLMEQETLKIKEVEKQYDSELKEWKAQLVPRKQKLEEEFSRQRDEQEKFYGAYVTGDVDGHPPYSRSSQGSVRSREDTMRSRHSTVI